MTIYATNTKRTCIGGNVFVDTVHPEYQDAISSYLKDKYNVDVYRTYDPETNGNVTLNSFTYPFATSDDARNFIKGLYVDPESDFNTTVGDRVWHWYLAQNEETGQLWTLSRQIVEITSDTLTVPEALDAGKFVVVFEKKII